MTRSTFGFRFGFFAGAVLVGATLAADVATAALTEAQKCRAVIQDQNTRYLGRTHRIRQRCLRGVFRSRLPVTTDCVRGIGDDKSALYLDQVRTRVGKRITKGCIGIDLVELGYPGQCTDSSGAPFDTFDLEQCIANETDEIVAEMLDLEYPPATFLPPRYLSCVNGVGARGGDVVRSEVKARSGCLLRDELDPFTESECRSQMMPYGPGTTDAKTDDRILRSYVGLLAGIPDVCSGLNVDFLGYTDDCEDPTGGRFNTFDLKLCLFDTHRVLAQQSLRLAFPTAPVCGDGEIGPDEECDDGNTSDTDACLADCTLAICGDGFVRAGVEECDDGNAAQTDVCLTTCKLAKCGDGFTRTGVELCDDGNTSNTDACLSNCVSATCGDTFRCTALSCTSGPGSGPEDCDDGNSASGDGCTSTCGIEFCGDGIINNRTEECDDGSANGNAPNKCRLGTCQLPECGDEIIDDASPFDESCDPPNGVTCNDDCVALLCGNGEIDDGEECDDGVDNSNTVPDACRDSCRNAGCSDGVVDSGEDCDDANQSNTDACTNQCVDAVCGDGLVRAGVEDCDDGTGNSNTVPDACRTTCEEAGCGDDVVDSGEQCDDGNAVATDACTGTCRNNVCGDGVLFAGVEDCDNGASNSNTTPNACRTNCEAAGCGDAVVDTGEECDGTSDAACPGEEICNTSCDCQGAAQECPGSGELTVLSGHGKICSETTDCEAGECIDGRCRTATRLDTGLSGIAHDSDITDEVTVRGFLNCGGTFPCGVCELEGIDPSPGYCRCADDNRTVCDQPFVADSDDCGGQICNCYFGPPLALSAGNTPACVVNRFRKDVSGTANVDLGAGEVNASLSSIVFLGISTIKPCPSCNGDVISNDGVRDGTCSGGRNDGLDCDVNGTNHSFPAPGGGGHSIDCLPDPGVNVSGANGLLIDLTQVTSRVELGVSGDIECNFPPAPATPLIRNTCFCALCSGDTSLPCSTDAECAAVGAGTCSSFGGDSFPFVNNKCAGGKNESCVPIDAEGIFGQCDIGPDDKFCDGILRASGEGFFQCNSNADCAETIVGIPAGSCAFTKRRPCFLDPVVAIGEPSPQTPIGAAVFCIPRVASSPAINTVAGIPGPGRVVNQVRSQLFCESDPSVQYVPGVGGCP